MKPVIIGVIGLLVGLGGSTGVVALSSRGSGAGPARDSLPDSAAVAVVDTAAAPARDTAAAVVPTAAAPALPSTEAAKPDSEGAPPMTAVAAAPISKSAQADTAPAPVTSAPLDTAAFRQLAKIFTSMKPSDAVRIMDHLSDADVEGVLRHLQPRASAQLMAALPPERAAALGKRLLKGEEK